MASACFIGVDVGTGSAKAVVFEPSRGVLGRGAAGYPVDTPRPGWAEQDPRQWWSGVARAIRAAVADAGVAPRDVDALAVSGQGAAVVLVDERGEPLRPALIHLDQRAAREAEALAGAEFGRVVRRVSGNAVGAWNAGAKLVWLRGHEPDRVDHASGVTSAAGFVLRRLTGRLVQSTSDAGISDLFDMRSRDWARELVDAVQLRAEQLPEVAPATAEVGRLAPAAAAATGLPESVRVLAGGEDTSSAALAAGVVAVGEAYLSLGTAGVVGVAVDGGTTDEPRLLSFPHVRERIDLLSGSMSSAGGALTWWSGVTDRSPAELLAEAEAEPGRGAQSDVAFLPYLAGELHPINDPDARGLFSGLSLASSRADMTRAIVEGSASAVAHNVEVASTAGGPPQRLSATGGPTRSALWMQAVSDATGLPVEVVGDDGAAVGDAMIAASRTDADLEQIARAHRHVSQRYEPDADRMTRAVARRAATSRLYEASRGR